MEKSYPVDSQYPVARSTLARLVHRSAAAVPAALISITLLGISGAALADHDVTHAVANLKGGVGALEQRIWDCENGRGGCARAKGDKGDTGLQGPIGETGATGPQGIQGGVGPQGETGATGPQGPQGIQGGVGPQGETGATGPQGPQGIQGGVGPQGETGATGAQGPQGIQGEVGPQGEIGATGPQGPQGIQGEVGPQGETGATGPQGPQGQAGTAGQQGAQGIQGPSGLAAWERIEVSCAGSTVTCTAACPTGSKVLGGGVSSTAANGNVVQSYPATEGSWTVTVKNGDAIKAYAICALTN